MPSTERVAIFPGSFDPITRGHEDIVRRALRIADRVIVAVGWSPTQTKKAMFEVSERLEILQEVFRGEPAVDVADFQGLLVDFARARGANIVVRGIRGVRDFEYEFQMALMNRELHPDLETVFLVPEASRSYISSSLVRDIARLGGDVSSFVSEPVLRTIRSKIEEDLS